MKQFGEKVEGFDIPVLNEREIRASAGILFLVIFFSLMLIIFRQNFLLIKYVITLFLTDFMIRVFINPGYSPTLILGRLIVSRQNPEYVGAAQKKFAWYIGIALAAIMFVLMVLVNSYSVITGLICLICMVFLFFESAFGICLGCLFYPMFFKDKARYCPGEVCDIKNKADILKTSWKQIIILFSFAAFIVFLAVFFNENLTESPRELWSIMRSAPAK
jgi:hypothetical protein